MRDQRASPNLLADHLWEVYNLPQEPVLPATRVFTGLITGMLTMVSLGPAAAVAFAAGRND